MRSISEKYGQKMNWKRIGFGMGVSALLTVVMAAAGAWLLDRELVELQWENYLAALILLASSFAGVKSAGTGENKWISSAAVGAGYWLVLLSVNALLFDGDLGGAGETALAILGGCGAAALLGSSGGGFRSRRRKRPMGRMPKKHGR